VAVRAFLDDLEVFVVRAKAATFASGRDGQGDDPSRPESIEHRFEEGRFCYLDSVVGGTHFVGQEIVYLFNEPIWAMNYHGRIIDPAYEPPHVVPVIQAGLSAVYDEGRFLGGSDLDVGEFHYCDVNEGSIDDFSGYETIDVDGQYVYRLRYHGGLIRTWREDAI
jgi:Domain of unknown function (DUF5680)